MKNYLFILSTIALLLLCGCDNHKPTSSEEETEEIQSVVSETVQQENIPVEDEDTEIPMPSFEAESDYEEEEYSRYDNYQETSSCCNGVIIYEGSSDYFIVETNRGYTILERYSGGILYEGDQLRGELNSYNFKYILKTRTDSEVRVYIEDYMLSKQRAIEWMGEHGKLKYSDQEEYDRDEDY